MVKLATALVLFTLAVAPAQAMKDIAVDWETGEVTVTEEPVDEEAEETAVRR